MRGPYQSVDRTGAVFGVEVSKKETPTQSLLREIKGKMDMGTPISEIRDDYFHIWNRHGRMLEKYSKVYHLYSYNVYIMK